MIGHVHGPFDREAALAGLIRALPYVRLYRGQSFVIKLAGSVVAEPDALAATIEQIHVLAELGVRVVVVHGAGPQATALSERLGLETKFVEGRRITSPAVLDAVVMAQNGSVNTALLSACRKAHLAAIGLSGIDAALVNARKRPPVRSAAHKGEPIDFGEVGDVVSVDGSVLDRLLAAGFVPIVASLAADERGRVLNINADTVAARIASGIGAAKLIYLTDAPGLLEDPEDRSSLVSYIDPAGLDRLAAAGALSGGILPKLAAARSALEGGVPRVHIVGFRGHAPLLAEIFTNEGAGTLIVRDTAELPAAEQEPGTVERSS